MVSLFRSCLIFTSIFIYFDDQLLANESISFDTNINAPLKVDADKMYIDKIALEGGLSGSVIINQGPLNLRADQMEFTFTDNASMPVIKNLYASNGVVISNQDMTATGNNASYSVSNNEIILLGSVTVVNNFTTLKGDKLLIDLETGAINFIADDNQSNRVKGVLMQSEKKMNSDMIGKPSVITNNDKGLEIKRISKSYNNRPVVREVSFNINKGEAVGLLGPNGSGKTTIFYTIIGLIKPNTGSIFLNGFDVTDLPIYKRSKNGIGYLPQEASIFRGMNVEDNIKSILEIVETDKQVIESNLDQLLTEFDISHLRRTPSLALSGGERRRVEIARCLAGKPNYILLDEPFAGIDPIALSEIKELVSHLKDKGVGVLITDHNVRETMGLIDRAVLIHEGSVLIEGKPEDIIKNDDVRRVYLGERFSI